MSACQRHVRNSVQVIVNVLINACYVMPEGGEIEISRVKLSDSQVTDHIQSKK